MVFSNQLIFNVPGRECSSRYRYIFVIIEIKPYFACYTERNRKNLMKRYITGKILVILIVITPLFAVNSCDKQEKCGCDGDVLFTVDKRLMNYSDLTVLSEGSTIYFTIGYDTYYFCNPAEMYTELQKINSKDQILLTGDVFWDCNYVTQAGQSNYYYYYKFYNIHVTELKSYLYGK